MNSTNGQKPPWCIVVADDHGPEWAPLMELNEQPMPVQYSRLGGNTTLLQRALQRASRFAPISQIIVTTLDEYRQFWEPTLWFVRPENRFVCESRAGSSLTAAAAMLSIAETSPSEIVVVLPGRCHVLQESVLGAALNHGIALLPRVVEGALQLAMMDGGEGIDEDYLMFENRGPGVGLRVQSVARRPTAWVARHLRQRGALISSGIMIGYAGVFVDHITRQWPGLTQKLNKLIVTATKASAECELPLQLNRGVPRPTLNSLRWHAPAFPQRAVFVEGCGWSGLRSARAVAHTREYLANAARAVNAIGGRGPDCAAPPRNYYNPRIFDHSTAP